MPRITRTAPSVRHNHGVELSEAKKQELMGLVGTMVQLGYIRMEEVPGSRTGRGRSRSPCTRLLSKMPCPPDLVLVRGTAAQLMVLVEAAQAAGVAPDAPAMGRPTCAALPQALDSRRPAMSLGCIGNRVYTGLADGKGTWRCRRPPREQSPQARGDGAGERRAGEVPSGAGPSR